MGSRTHLAVGLQCQWIPALDLLVLVLVLVLVVVDDGGGVVRMEEEIQECGVVVLVVGREPKDFGPTGHDYTLSQDAGPNISDLTKDEINAMLAERLQYKISRNFPDADRIQAQLRDAGVYVNDALKGMASGRCHVLAIITEVMVDPENSKTHAAAIAIIDRTSNPRIRVVAVALMDQQHYLPMKLRKLKRSFRNEPVPSCHGITTWLMTFDNNFVTIFNVFVDDRLRQWSVGNDFGPNAFAARGGGIDDRPWKMPPFSQEIINDETEAVVLAELEKRTEAKRLRDYETADAIRDGLLAEYNVVVNDRLREWSIGGEFGLTSPKNSKREDRRRNRPFVRRGGGDISEEEEAEIAAMVEERAEAQKIRNFETADALRDALESVYSVKVDDRSTSCYSCARRSAEIVFVFFAEGDTYDIYLTLVASFSRS